MTTHSIRQVLSSLVIVGALAGPAVAAPVAVAAGVEAATTPTDPAAAQAIIDAAFARQEAGATLARVRELLDESAGHPAIDHARGTVRFLEAIQWLLQGATRHGFLQTFRGAGLMLTPQADLLQWTATDDPAVTPAGAIDLALRGFVARLAEADGVLAEVDGPFTAAIELPAIRFDLDGDGEATSAEGLRSFFPMLPEMRRWDPEERRTVVAPMVPPTLVVAFDRGDTEWLRGYCHLLSAAAEAVLAHDHREWFDHTGFVLFPRAVTSHEQLPGTSWSMERITGMQVPADFDLTDVLAMIGNLQMPVDEPERLALALEHLRAAVDHGRAMWAAYDAETDDDREWIPNPRQTAAFHAVQVDPALRDAWLALIDEADAVLDGRKLLRYWRGDGTRGIDLVKVFLEPRDFNLLYWVQGSAATPYLREGEFTAPRTWAQIRRLTDQRVLRYSFWFN